MINNTPKKSLTLSQFKEKLNAFKYINNEKTVKKQNDDD